MTCFPILILGLPLRKLPPAARGLSLDFIESLATSQQRRLWTKQGCLAPPTPTLQDLNLSHNSRVLGEISLYSWRSLDLDQCYRHVIITEWGHTVKRWTTSLPASPSSVRYIPYQCPYCPPASLENIWVWLLSLPLRRAHSRSNTQCCVSV